MQKFIAITAGALVASAASAQIRVTEWMYSGNGAEFVELTNVGGAAIDMSGWSFDDDSATPFVFDLSGFGIVQAGQSVIFTEDNAAAFATTWNLNASVVVVGGVTNNLGRNDQINIFDGAGVLVDRLTFGDEAFVGSIRTQRFSGNPNSVGALGADDVYQWSLSFVGDGFGSYASSLGDVGNPGAYVPAPGAAALIGLAGLVTGRRRR